VFFCKRWTSFPEVKQPWAPFFPGFLGILPRFSEVLLKFSGVLPKFSTIQSFWGCACNPCTPAFSTTVIVDMDADPNTSISLVTETTDLPTLDLKHVDAASLYHKIIQLCKDVEQQREVKNCSCDEDDNLYASDLKYFRNDLQDVAEETKKLAN